MLFYKVALGASCFAIAFHVSPKPLTAPMGKMHGRNICALAIERNFLSASHTPAPISHPDIEAELAHSIALEPHHHRIFAEAWGRILGLGVR